MPLINMQDSSDSTQAINRLSGNLVKLGKSVTADNTPALTAAAVAGLATAMAQKNARRYPLTSITLTAFAGFALARGLNRRAPDRPMPPPIEHPVLAGMAKAALHLIADGLTAMSLADRFKPDN